MILFDKVKKYRYISFDVFDTLIKRSVAQPADLFELMEMMGAPKGFAEKRKQAEHRSWEKTRKPVTLNEIYDELRKCEDDKFAAMKAVEISLELSGCRANPIFAKLLCQCVEAGKTVVLVSDMYLPSEVISAMLEKCGITGYSKLYVSCEAKAGKRNGALYTKVLEDLGIQPRELLHIGDNFKSDFLRPIVMGIRAMRVKNDQKKMCHVPRNIPKDKALIQRTVQACVRNACVGLNEVQRHGCAVFGPLLYGFTVWLKEQLRQDDIHDVYFMAREGLIMKQAFDNMKTLDEKTHYMYCSRRSFIVPTLCENSDFESVFDAAIYSTIKRITLREFIEHIGLEPPEYEAKIHSFGLDMDTIFQREEFLQSKAVRSFYEEIRRDIVSNSQRERDALLSYLSTLAMDKRIALVDIGYNGSMQAAFERIIKRSGLDITPKGYYLGIRFNASRFITGMLGAGYLCDSTRNESISNDLTGTILALFEAPFLAFHGSVKKFVFEKGQSIPVFSDFEYAFNEDRRIDETKFIKEIQDGMMAFVEYMRDAFCNYSILIHPECAFHPYRKMTRNPALREAKWWGDCRNFNYGQVFWIAAPRRNLWHYLFHFQLLKDDLLSARWRIGFMKRLFHIPLPYAAIDKVLETIGRTIRACSH